MDKDKLKICDKNGYNIYIYMGIHVLVCIRESVCVCSENGHIYKNG